MFCTCVKLCFVRAWRAYYVGVRKFYTKIVSFNLFPSFFILSLYAYRMPNVERFLHILQYRMHCACLVSEAVMGTSEVHLRETGKATVLVKLKKNVTLMKRECSTRDCVKLTTIQY